MRPNHYLGTPLRPMDVQDHPPMNPIRTNRSTRANCLSNSSRNPPTRPARTQPTMASMVTMASVRQYLMLLLIWFRTFPRHHHQNHLDLPLRYHHLLLNLCLHNHPLLLLNPVRLVHLHLLFHPPSLLRTPVDYPPWALKTVTQDPTSGVCSRP